MTAVMRAVVPVAGPKVLRIGLVQGGRVIEERTLLRTSVTIGPSEACDMLVPDPSIPPRFKLLERVGAHYYLNLLDTMTGRVALETGIVDIATLRVRARTRRVKITEAARGMVVIGDTSLLFQFVAPPPAQPRPQLPLTVKAGLASSIDWTLTVIAAFSFLLHFGVIGAMYSDWMDPLIDEGVTTGGLIDAMNRIPPAVVETAADPSELVAERVTPTPKAAPAAPTSTSPSDGKKPGAAPQRASASDRQAAALAARAEEFGLEVLAGTKGPSALENVLRQGEIPPVDLSGVAPSAAGVSASTGNGLNFGRGGELVRPGSEEHGLAQIGVFKADRSSKRANEEQITAGPRSDAVVEPLIPTLPVANAEGTVAKLRPGFRACYNQGLQSDPGMSGKVTVSAKIAPNGEVASADVAQQAGLSTGVVECILRRVRAAQFDAPGPNGSTIKIPITLVQQGK
jgi:outer membrane biosynthesis protein TonB